MSTAPYAYLNVVEVEAAIGRLAAQHPSRCRLIDLPELTHEKRRCRALEVLSGNAAGSGGAQQALLVVASAHGREWVTADAAVAFVADLLGALELGGSAVRYGRKSFDVAALRRFADRCDLIVLPQLNPDGRAHSLVYDGGSSDGWRKNRRPLLPGMKPPIGVDLNRNYETAWDFPRFFLPGVVHTSTSRTEQSYRGQMPLSEAETRNVMWLLKQKPGIRWLVDVHGGGESIQYDWGIDSTQSNDTDKHIGNTRWDRLRGERGDAYEEFKDGNDSALAKRLAARMSRAVFEVGGSKWPAGTVFDTMYAVSGALTDQAYAMRSGATRIHTFVVEHGGPMRPPDPRPVIAEISAALMELCVAIGEG